MTYATDRGKAKCTCGEYEAYGDTLEGINAPMFSLDTCINCYSKLINSDEYKESFRKAIEKINNTLER